MEEGCIEHNLLESILDRRMTPRDLPFSLLEKITGNFAEKQIIGEGGFARVYKGVLQNDNVAVKRILSTKTIDETLFQREVNSLTHVDHQNIVRFLGFCSNTVHTQTEYEGKFIFAENRERLLCFEYINNGSLDKYITDELRGLEWNERYNIIKGICNGLEYLHGNRKIVHMDLKPANILLDNDKMAKITDFGLSRKVENLSTCTNHFFTRGYCAPEYLLDGKKISLKCDVYSLGVIIIELVTGHRHIRDKTNVLKRWRHRLKKSGEETPFTYQQIATLIQIGLLCKENDPDKRPSISKIISDIDTLESTNNTDTSTIGQISTYTEDEMLGIEPLELRFPIELNTKPSCSLVLTNETHSYFAFSIQTASTLLYCIEPTEGIVAPQSNYRVKIALQLLEKATQDMQHTHDFIVRSTKLNGSPMTGNITKDMFKDQKGKVVDEVNVTVAHAKSKIISHTSDKLIQVDPPKLRFPLVPDKKVLSSVNIVNITEDYVGFNLFFRNSKAKYHASPWRAILPPRSTQRLMVTREESEEALKDTQSTEKAFLWRAVVPKYYKDNDLYCMNMNESMELPMDLTEIRRCTSNDLIQLCPPEISFPLLQTIPFVSTVTIVNNMDFNIGFEFRNLLSLSGMYMVVPYVGIVPPYLTQRVVFVRVCKEPEVLGGVFSRNRREKQPGLVDDMQDCQGSFFRVMNIIVDEGVEADYLTDNIISEYPVNLPIRLNKVIPQKIHTTFFSYVEDKLIRYDPPRITFPFLPNKTLMSSINMVNNTDYSVGFCNYVFKAKAWYYTEPRYGILPPRSSQKLVVKRVPKENELHDLKCKDKYIMWNAIVSDGVIDGDLSCLMNYKDGNELPNHDLYDQTMEQAKRTWWPDYVLYASVVVKKEHTELPIVLTKISSCTAHELIQIEPPELCFPLLPSESQISSIKIVNITNYFVGFNTFDKKSNVASYNTEPSCGILPPNSTQELVVIRVAKEEDTLENRKHCKDRYLLWSSFVTKDVDDIYLEGCTSEAESKYLPIVFTKTRSNKLIQLDPPKLCFPLSNKSVLSSVKLVNVTDDTISFSISNSARYYTDPSKGILSPRSSQILMVTRVAAKTKKLQDRKFKEKYLVWGRIVPHGVKGNGSSDCVVEQDSTELPIVRTKTKSQSISEELIQLDPPELCFPLLPNKTVVSSVTIINNTYFNIGYCVRDTPANGGMYKTDPDPRILLPRSAHKIIVKRLPSEEDIHAYKNGTHQEMQLPLERRRKQGMLLVCYMILAKRVQAHNLVNYLGAGNTKELPIVLTKTIQCTSNELIRFDPPRLSFPFLPNKTLLSSVNMINNTYHSVIFCNYVWNAKARYYTEPRYGILPPQSTQKLVVKRVPMGNELHDMECKDKYIMWNAIVSDGVEGSDLSYVTTDQDGTKLPNYDLYNQTVEEGKRALSSWPNLLFHGRILRRKENTELPIVLTKVQHLFATGSSRWPFSLSFATGTHQNHLISSSAANEVIRIEPSELCFPFLWSVSQKSSIKIVNITDYFIGFNTFEKKTNVASYNTEPPFGILPPNSTQELVVTRVAKEDEEAPEDMMHCKDKYFLWSSFVTEHVAAIYLNGCTSETESEDLPIVFRQTSSNEFIQFDPPKLCLPLSDESVMSPVNIVNVTEHNISFSICTRSNSTRYYTDPSKGVLLPWSTQVLKVVRVPEEKELQDTKFEDKYLVWNSVVPEGVQASDVVHNMSATKITDLPIVLTEISTSTSSELIQFDPCELCFPILPKGKALSSVNIVNITDSYIGFSTYSMAANMAWYHTKPSKGVLPPQSTQRLMVTREEKEYAASDIQFNDKYFVWNRIVPEGVKGSDLSEYMVEQESKELPIVLTETSLQSTSKDLIRFDPPKLSFPFQPNKTVMSSITMINNTDYHVGFNQHDSKGNMAWYKTKPRRGIMPPRSSKRLVVKRIPKKKEQEEDVQGEDKFFLWNMTVTKGVKASHLIKWVADEDSIKLPIVIEKTSLLCTSDDLIQFDPPQLHFPFAPTKWMATWCLTKIVNVTDHYVGFNTWTSTKSDNSVRYYVGPSRGILPPHTTQDIKVRRVIKKKKSQDMQCNDLVGFWNSIVTKGIETGDFTGDMDDEESKVLHIVLTKTRPQCTPKQLIRFDPPKLSFPFQPNKTVMSSVSITNTTDYYVGFSQYCNEGNVAWYYTKPHIGIMPPGSTQRLVVRRLAKKEEEGDIAKGDRFFLRNMIVTEGVDATNLNGWMDDEDKTELPIVLEKTNLCSSDELIQCDPPQLRFPFSPNKSATTLCSIKIVNVTDHCIGFHTCASEDNNFALYGTYPFQGILPPRSTQELVVRRIPNERESEEIQCKGDIVRVWNIIVTKGVETSDLSCCRPEEIKQLPVVIAKPGESSSTQAWLGRIFRK